MGQFLQLAYLYLSERCWTLFGGNYHDPDATLSITQPKKDTNCVLSTGGLVDQSISDHLQPKKLCYWHTLTSSDQQLVNNNSRWPTFFVPFFSILMNEKYKTSVALTVGLPSTAPPPSPKKKKNSPMTSQERGNFRLQVLSWMKKKKKKKKQAVIILPWKIRCQNVSFNHAVRFQKKKPKKNCKLIDFYSTVPHLLPRSRSWTWEPNFESRVGKRRWSGKRCVL